MATLSLVNLDRLQAQLLTSGLQQSNNALYQVITQLLSAVRQLQSNINSSITDINNTISVLNTITQVIITNPSDQVDGADGLVIPGPQGIQGLSGSQGVPGLDGADVDEPIVSYGEPALLNIDNYLRFNQRFGTTQNFSWSTRTSATVYQAASDGFFCGTIQTNNGNFGEGQIFSDTSNPPITERFRAGSTTGVPDTAPGCWTFTVPIRKGDFYTLTLTGSTSLLFCWWVPLGVNG